MIPEALLPVVEEWKNCRQCPIGTWAYKHVFADGTAPAPFLFVGEGPGVSEDILGVPFIGPSGKLLREGLALAGFRTNEWCLTNLVCCRPSDGPSKRNRVPTDPEIALCADRLEATIALVKPRVIVAVGRVADANLPHDSQTEYRNIIRTAIHHPAFILRQGGRGTELYDFWISDLKKTRRLVK